MPRITLRQLLIGMVFVAIYLAIVAMAWRGSYVAFGLAVSCAALLPVLVIYAAWYWLLVAVAETVFKRSGEDQSGSTASEKPVGLDPR